MKISEINKLSELSLKNQMNYKYNYFMTDHDELSIMISDHNIEIKLLFIKNNSSDNGDIDDFKIINKYYNIYYNKIEDIIRYYNDILSYINKYFHLDKIININSLSRNEIIEYRDLFNWKKY